MLDFQIELYDMTKKGCISKIHRDNRLFIAWTGRKWGYYDKEIIIKMVYEQ